MTSTEKPDAVNSDSSASPHAESERQTYQVHTRTISCIVFGET